jgi:hypothetical protein
MPVGHGELDLEGIEVDQRDETAANVTVPLMPNAS